MSEEPGEQISENAESMESKEKSEEFKGEDSKSSDIVLIISIVVVILLVASLAAFVILTKERPKTIEELHQLNIMGKLKPSEGYMYKGVYSFINFSNEWYTQLKSPKGSKIYNLAMRYSPRDLENIFIEGNLDTNFFNNQSEFYVTFDPTGREFTHILLAVADFDNHMAKIFEKNPIAACDRNETEPCATRPIITCEDTDKLVLYIKESEKLRAYYNNNCIVVEGRDFDIVKGVYRILYNLYEIM
jgi:hypothetical protein